MSDMKPAIGAIVLVLSTACSTSDDASTPRDASSDDGVSDALTTDGSDAEGDASGGSSGSSGDAGAADASDAGQDVESGEPDAICEGLDEPTCKNTPGCIALPGQKLSTGKTGYAGCAQWCVGSAVGSCALAPDKACWKFPDTCAPDGWTALNYCSDAPQCTTSSDAAAD